MKSIKDITTNKKTSIKDVIKIIDKSAKQICLVMDNNQRLIGTVTDGDIRKGLLNNISLSDPVDSISNKTPITANINDSREQILNIFKTEKIHQIPIINDNNIVVGIEIIDEIFSKKKYNNTVILMVGGIGSRLRPLTEDIPKPMLNIGGKPILQTIVEGFQKSGFTKIIMCTGYKSEKIQDYFKDGSKFGVEIEYIVEDSKTGTVGALTLLKKRPKEVFFVMNGDLLTNVNFKKMLDFHKINESQATMCVREYDHTVPFGVVACDNHKISSIDEKPVHSFFVNAGIYLLEPECIDLIPKNEFFNMTSLFEKILSKGGNATAFPLQEYWLDIGRISEYNKANAEFNQLF